MRANEQVRRQAGEKDGLLCNQLCSNSSECVSRVARPSLILGSSSEVLASIRCKSPPTPLILTTTAAATKVEATARTTPAGTSTATTTTTTCLRAPSSEFEVCSLGSFRSRPRRRRHRFSHSRSALAKTGSERAESKSMHNSISLQRKTSGFPEAILWCTSSTLYISLNQPPQQPAR